MTEKHRMIEDFFNRIGFRERIVIGIYDEGRIYFDIDFSEKLANGLMTSAFMNDKIHGGIKELIAIYHWIVVLYLTIRNYVLVIFKHTLKT